MTNQNTFNSTFFIIWFLQELHWAREFTSPEMPQNQHIMPAILELMLETDVYISLRSWWDSIVKETRPNRWYLLQRMLPDRKYCLILWWMMMEVRASSLCSLIISAIPNISSSFDQMKLIVNCYSWFIITFVRVGLESAAGLGKFVYTSLFDAPISFFLEHY